jgi:predicted Zn finger-like uncharacterized protein
MSVRVRCPACKVRFGVAEEKLGERVRCRECGEAFTAHEIDGAEEGQRRRRDEEGEEVRQGSPSGGGRALLLVLLGGGALLLLLCAGVGVGIAALLLSKPDKQDVQVAQGGPGPDVKPPDVKRPDEKPPVGKKQPEQEPPPRPPEPRLLVPCKVTHANEIAFTDSGDAVAVVYQKGLRDRRVTVLDVKTGQSKGDAELPHPSKMATKACPSPDGKRIAYRDDQGLISVIDVTDGRVLVSGFTPDAEAAKKASTGIHWMAWVAPDRLLTASVHGIAAWDLDRKQAIYVVNPADVNRVKGVFGRHLSIHVALSPDARNLLIYDGETFRFLGVATGRLGASLESPKKLAKEPAPRHVAFRPDGKQLVARFAAENGLGDGPDLLVRWDLQTGKILKSGPQPKVPHRFAQVDDDARPTNGPTYWGDRHLIVWSVFNLGIAVLDTERGEWVCNVVPPTLSRVFGSGPDGRLWCLFHDETSKLPDAPRSKLVPIAFPDPPPPTRRQHYNLRPTGLDLKQ